MVFGEGALETVGLTPSFWQGKTVLITGHTGFKGSWLSLWLQKMGAHCVGYALAPPSQPNLYALAEVNDVMLDSVYADINHTDTLLQTLETYRPEIILHLAAQSIVSYGYQYPVETFKTNALGTANVLSAAQKVGCAQCIVVVTSDKCYQNQHWSWPYRENDALGGSDPYSSSKACAELVVESFRKSFALPIATVRAGNVIGGGDWANDRLLPDTVRAVLSRAPMKIRNPNAVRPWQHVLDPLYGYLRLVEVAYQKGTVCHRAWNFGPSLDGIATVSTVLDGFLTAWGEPYTYEVEKSDFVETESLQIDASLAQQVLGWKSKLRLEDALSWTADWYQAYRKNENLQHITLKQIERYEDLL